MSRDVLTLFVPFAVFAGFALFGIWRAVAHIHAQSVMTNRLLRDLSYQRARERGDGEHWQDPSLMD